MPLFNLFHLFKSDITLTAIWPKPSHGNSGNCRTELNQSEISNGQNAECNCIINLWYQCFSTQALFQPHSILAEALFKPLDVLFWWTLSLIELSTDNFCGTRSENSIHFSKNNWFSTPRGWTFTLRLNTVFSPLGLVRI